MAQSLQQLNSVWKKLGVNQKATILLMLVGLVVGVAVLVHISRRPSYEMLYSDLEEKDMARVAAYLKESSIPYRVTNGGATIFVSEGKKYDVRLGLANKGVLPGGRVGLELFTNTGWGASPRVERILERRAMQGELARTIMHMEPIAWADVQIAQPEATPFADEQKPATAALQLKLKPGASLRASQITGICRLIAGSVEGLEPQNVTIIDGRGNLLSTPQSDTVGAHASDLQGYRRAYEEYLAAKAQTLLDRALGPGRSVVKVSAVLDMDRISETKEEYDTDSRVARTEKIVSRTSSGEGGGAASSEEETETTYDVPKTVRSIQNAPGSVKHLDVAVIVNNAFTDADGNEATLPDAEIKNLEALVKSAIGLVESPPRSDTIKLAAMAFRKPPEQAVDTAQENPGKQQYYLQIIKYASSVLAVIIFAIFVSILAKRTARSSGAASGEGAAAGRSPLMTAGMLTMSPSGSGNGHAKLRNRVKDIIAGDPLSAARLIQNWLNEDNPRQKGRSSG